MQGDYSYIPSEIQDLVERTFLFKIQIKADDIARRTEVFSVVKVYTDSSLIAKYSILDGDQEVIFSFNYTYIYIYICIFICLFIYLIFIFISWLFMFNTVWYVGH